MIRTNVISSFARLICYLLKKLLFFLFFLCCFFFFFFFFFSSRRRHTRSLRDWSSDVCSSDLYLASAFNNIMDLLQLVFGFVNAPLFATFLLGMFWKRATGHGAFFEIGRASCRERV